MRDKLMGLESDDIDIALDDMYGEELAEMIRHKIFEQEMAAGNPDAKKASKGYGVIKSNSEKSKHLETAVIKVFGEFIDLVNLRSEEYGEDSRVPIIKIGTPEQDALRRDLTINSMFFNINTGLIEDLTGNGVSDLTHGIARTPLEPLKTFVDDPLRVLRAIRFAQRFGFKITDEIMQAALNPKVKDAFAHKITFERIQKEMDKIFSDREAHKSMQQIFLFGIAQLCIKPPSDCNELSDPETIETKMLPLSVFICNILGILFSTLKQNNNSLIGINFPDDLKNLQMSCFYTGLLLPFKDF